MGKRKHSTAARADKYKLYEKSVQNPKADVKFILKTYRKLRRRNPSFLREDFCGTAALCRAWVKHNDGHEALGIDLDQEVLEYARRTDSMKPCNGRAGRLRLLNADVLRVRPQRRADVVTAFNFSYWLFAERKQMHQYFRGVHSGLAMGGVFVLDAFGGAEAYQEQKEETRFRKFRYIWEQAAYDPITGMQTCHINFRFPDGSKLAPAFSYHWRIWSLPEIRELLEEAGFASVQVYWEGTDPKTGEGNGVYKPVVRGEADPAWITYIVAAK